VQVSNLKNSNSCGCLKSELTRARMSKPAGTAATNQVLGSYRANARKRGLAWKISLALFKKLIMSPCHYCGVADSMLAIKHRDQIRHNGIDRQDSLKGYTPENCVPACRTCNNAKASMTVEEFLAWARRLVSR
jgi:5-methylcytosine-specific restriction endonuclease McrA